jgi:hypothetical protein
VAARDGIVDNRDAPAAERLSVSAIHSFALRFEQLALATARKLPEIRLQTILGRSGRRSGAELVHIIFTRLDHFLH